MKTSLVILITRLLALAFFLSIAGSANAKDINDDIYGLWKIKSIMGGGISSLSEHKARLYIGKIVIINADKFVFNGKTCLHPPYSRSVDDVDKYFDREWRADVTDTPLPNPVTIIDAKCNFLYPIRKNHIMIAEEGVFFEAVRIKK
ncbi:hypothetical protein INH39_13260 [Massilia violaceinigra]|uniref:DUF306 domain-containing protein n=1 Tax=Massilia violaceinigra TaxID=2045208 RepID=A0ABY4ACJ3_9BURK|nr:hypothetical protein [Massilia violaceinigra]UOD32530.1 hypothetical protein INH39_13260 [Massilia violaceinigra]